MTLNELQETDFLILNEKRFKELIDDLVVSENSDREEITEKFKAIKNEHFDTKTINQKTFLTINKKTKISFDFIASFFFELLKIQKEINWNDIAYKVKNLFGNQFIEKNKNGDIVLHSKIKDFIKKNPNIKWNGAKKYWELNQNNK